jgi:hypothetical protein
MDYKEPVHMIFIGMSLTRLMVLVRGIAKYQKLTRENEMGHQLSERNAINNKTQLLTL